MDNLKYVDLVNKVVPIRYNGINVILEDFINAISKVIRAQEELNDISRKLFCEDGWKTLESQKGYYNNCVSLPCQFVNFADGVKTMNAVLGISNESKKLLIEMQNAFKGRNMLNMQNLVSASSKIFQYQAYISKQTEYSFEEMQIVNSNTLRCVYPAEYEKFEIAVLNLEEGEL